MTTLKVSHKPFVAVSRVDDTFHVSVFVLCIGDCTISDFEETALTRKRINLSYASSDINYSYDSATNHTTSAVTSNHKIIEKTFSFPTRNEHNQPFTMLTVRVTNYNNKTKIDLIDDVDELGTNLTNIPHLYLQNDKNNSGNYNPIMLVKAKISSSHINSYIKDPGQNNVEFRFDISTPSLSDENNFISIGKYVDADPSDSEGFFYARIEGNKKGKIKNQNADEVGGGTIESDK
ncbi:MAG: hypothetical protein GYB31_03040 [Bacteroidetes bacterium]|nr:hypothetical protein [Bacteroidota bacterium]